jgi:hypothetical protein
MLKRTIKRFCEKLPENANINVYAHMTKEELFNVLNKKDDEISRLNYRIQFLLKTIEDLEKTKN